MEKQAAIHYKRIAAAIDFISKNFGRQPSLEEIAAEVHLSPSHFQRLFADWAGTTPKRFLQHISIQHAKEMLSEQRATLWDTAAATGLSSTSRLHDLFIQLEGMTPAEYKLGGKNLAINYHIEASPFGSVLIATTAKGICHMAFTNEDSATALAQLSTQFPQAQITEQQNEMQQQALQIFGHDWQNIPKIKLHLKGTPFQLKVWQCLLTLPYGSLSSYRQIAQQIGSPTASRAVGTAIGRNPIAFIIPCHRVIQTTGGIGGYMWGTNRKKAIIGWEAAQAK